MERRHSTRIPFRALAYVVQNGAPIPSEVVNISKRGLYLRTRSVHRYADSGLVSIELQRGQRHLSLTLPCSVARVCDDGVGWRAPQLIPETLLFMSNLLSSRDLASTDFVQTFYDYLDGLEFHLQSPYAEG